MSMTEHLLREAQPWTDADGDEDAMAAHHEVIKAMEGFVEEQLGWLTPAGQAWQPSDILPDFSTEEWPEAVERLRAGARSLSDDVLVVLVGDTITEEALPSYQTMTNRHGGIADATGDSEAPWARWTRGWTAEEHRHGEILSRYLYLSGRVDMRAVERTTQSLIRNGFNPNTKNDPYRGLIYTSFQERATRVSHGTWRNWRTRAETRCWGKSVPWWPAMKLATKRSTSGSSGNSWSWILQAP